jgi:predicted transglutaminase-like cysteine proteinase
MSDDLEQYLKQQGFVTDGKKRKKKKPGSLRRCLCAAFAAVAVTGAGVGGYVIFRGQQQGSGSTTAPTAPASAPDTITVFNNTAKHTVESEDPYAPNWTAMLRNQSKLSQEPQYEGPYQSFLAQFNKYKGETLFQMATNVNALVEQEISYSDNGPLYNDRYYWATPIETAFNKAGDCKDQSVLQYFIMRYLGVSDNRLFVADVNAEGKATGPDHAILLLNVASPGAPPSFVVMQDAAPVVPADNAVVSKTWQIVQANGKKVPADFVFYDARNQSGFWESKLTPLDYQHKVQTQISARAQVPRARSQKVSRAKSQVARVNPPAFRRYGKG